MKKSLDNIPGRQ